MEDSDLVIIARKSIKGVAALTSRTFLVQVLGIAANFILTLYLSPESFGVFFLVTAIVVFLNYFQDIGLAASLIQKKDEPTDLELKTVFTAQQALVLVIVIPALIFSGSLSAFYGIGEEGKLLFQAFLISFFLSSLRTIPTVMLERHLKFDKLVIPQIAENIAYNAALIYFVVTGWGITSFTIAVLLRSIIGLVLIYIVQPWKIGFAFSYPTIRSLLSYGVPFQLNSILALVKDDLLNLYIAKVLPLAQVGYIGFAQKWAFLPLRLVMDNVIKVTFPSFSRLQDDKKSLAILMEKSLFIITSFIFPVVISVIAFAPFFIQYFPKYQKWEPAVLALAFFSLNALVASVSVPFTNFLNAIGKIKTTLNIMIFLTSSTWILTPLFIFLFGFNGVALASFIVAATGIMAVFFVKQHVNFSFVHPIKYPLAASLIMIVSVTLLSQFITSLTTLFSVAGMVWIVYIVALFGLARKEFSKTVKFVMSNVR